MKVLVTGARGMVGSHVVDHLTGRGIDTISMGRECDLCDYRETRAMFEAYRPTHVFHSAARVYGIVGNMQNMGQCYFENNQINTNVIDSAHRIGVEKITVMGTGCVYPYPPLHLPLIESDIFMGRPHPSESGYAHAKLGMLAMLESYGMNFAYIVSCNLFGPRDKFETTTGHVVPSLVRKFYEAVRDGTDVIIWGDGSAQRDFIYIKDMARAAGLIMDHAQGPINIGSNSILYIRDIVRALTAISGINPDRVKWDATKPNGVDYRAYDLSKLSALGFSCNYSIEGGLAETWEWYVRQQNEKQPR